MRIGHAERAEALRALDEHFTAGRLDVDEFGDRSAAAGVATRRREIDALFRDLPEPHPATPPAAGTPVRRPDRRPAPGAAAALGVLLPLLAVAAVLALVLATGTPGGFVLFPLAFLLVGRLGPHRRP